MHDIKIIRDNVSDFKARIKNRGVDNKIVDKIIDLDQKKRELQTAQQDLQTERNKIAKEIGLSKRDKQDTSSLEIKAKKVNSDLEKYETDFSAVNQELHNILISLPNLAEDVVPIGKDESDNKEIRRWGEPKKFSFEAKAHYDLGENLDIMDFTLAAKISGARFVVMKNQLAKLERALVNFMLDQNVNEFGYQEYITPFLVNDDSLFGTGQLPKFAEDNFKTTDGYWLIPTAEVPLTNMVRDQIINQDTLPLRLTAYTPCFRSEAGSAGRDTRGMIRLHQFSKVELVSIVEAEKSQEEHERMLKCAEAILQKLNLPYRVMLLSSGDMGFSAQKTYDLEVWLPSQNCYREISSVSNCGDFQARRMKARYRKNNDKETKHLHTLNGSALAVGRTMVAILENYQQEDGSIKIPDILKDFMKIDFIK